MAVPQMVSGRLLLVLLMASMAAADFTNDFNITWGGHRAKIFKGGNLLSLSLDNTSGSGFQSKNSFLFGRIDMQLKLVSGNSAGTVTAFFMTSQGPAHDEIDFEFLGNSSGQPYTVHTNVYAQGKGGREQQFRMWFDPTRNFHTYSISWTPAKIIFLVDDTPIRVFENNMARLGVGFPTNQSMSILCSLWDAEDWATRGGLVKTDWSKAPFTAYFRNFRSDACVPPSSTNITCQPSVEVEDSQRQELDDKGSLRLRWVQKNFMIYNYCTDLKRFPQGLPPECLPHPRSS